MSVRSWAHYAILSLQGGEEATITPHGSSMVGRVEDGDEVVVAPVPIKTCPDCKGSGAKDDKPMPDADECPTCEGHGGWPDLDVDDIVLCRVKGKDYLHLIKAKQGDRCQIGNNCGGINGWIGRNAIYGVATKVAGVIVKTVEKELESSEES